MMGRADAKPRVFLITSDPAPWGLAACYHRAFVGRGMEATLYFLFGESADSFVASAVDRLAPLYCFKRSRALRRVEAAVAAFRPDLILVAKGTELDGEALSRLKAVSGALLFNIYPDSPFVYPGYPDLNGESFSSALRQYDCLFTFARFLVPVFALCGAPEVRYLPFAHDPSLHHPSSLDAATITSYGSPVAYLGTWGPSHERWLDTLLPFGLKIWGLHWDHLPSSSPLRDCWQRPDGARRGLGPDMAKVCGASAIVFNLVRAEHGCAHSMKTFEIPACQGLMITNRTDEQLEYFLEDRCAVYFSTNEELRDKVAFYLKNESAREKIAQEGHRRALDHTYLHRVDDVLLAYHELRGA